MSAQCSRQATDCATWRSRADYGGGPAAIETLLRYGVRFDRDTTGALSLGLEAAHARRRIVHATGDGTGRAIMRALSDAVRATPSITVLEGLEARRLLVVDGAISGVLATSSSSTVLLPTGRVVIATGGVGGLFLHSTNPRGAFGQGLALAARAGAELVDMEFVQFHPTALDTDSPPLTLVSEAARGEGATLVDETGTRFIEMTPGKGACAARRSRPRRVAAHVERPPRVPRRAPCAWQRLCAAFPGYRRVVRNCRHRPRHSADSDQAGCPLPHGRHQGRSGGVQ